MLDGFGDILNWLAAGLVFPLMLLPLAALAGGGRLSSAIWFAIVAGVAAAGVLFAWLAPVLAVRPAPMPIGVFLAALLVLTIIVAVAGGARNAVDHLAGPLERIVRRSGRAVMWLLFAMAFVQFAVVVLRYVFGINYIFMQESITYMHGAVFLIAAGYALTTDDHVRVDIFYREAPARRKALIDFLGTYLFLFPICVVLLWTASPYVASSWAVREGSAETSGIQGVFLLKSLIPAFAVLLAMAGFNIAAKAGTVLKDGDGSS